MTGINDQGHLTGGPINLSQFNPEQLAQLAGKIDTASPLSKDEIVSQLEVLQRDGISLDQSLLNRLETGHPVLTTPEAHALLSSNLGNLMNVLGTNPFLAANPLATFFETFLELAAKLTEAGLKEAELAGKSIVKRAGLASDTADLIREIGKLEMIAHIAAAVTAGVKMASSFLSARANAKIDTSLGDGHVMRESGKIRGYGESVSGLADMGKSITDAIIAVKKSEAEAEKVFTEYQAQAEEQVLSAAKEAYRGLSEMFSSTLQLLQKLADANKEANSWR